MAAFTISYEQLLRLKRPSEKRKEGKERYGTEKLQDEEKIEKFNNKVQNRSQTLEEEGKKTRRNEASQEFVPHLQRLQTVLLADFGKEKAMEQ